MSDTYVNIMLQSLSKKEEVLSKIIDLDNKQRAALENPELTPGEFDEIVEQKSVLAEQLEQLDSGFQKLFDRMKEELNENKEKYSEQIRRMQQHIRTITDMSMEIQTQEARNKDLMMKKFADVRQQARSVRTGTQVANKYYQNMGKVNYVDPQFMDTRSKG